LSVAVAGQVRARVVERALAFAPPPYGKQPSATAFDGSRLRGLRSSGLGGGGGGGSEATPALRPSVQNHRDNSGTMQIIRCHKLWQALPRALLASPYSSQWGPVAAHGVRGRPGLFFDIECTTEPCPWLYRENIAGTSGRGAALAFYTAIGCR
jgi:hypothetical protein